MKKTILTLLVGLTATTSARADLLAYEGFDYPEGIFNSAGMNGGAGWAGPWQAVSLPAGSIQPLSAGGSMVADINSPPGYDARSMGNALFIRNGSRSGRWLDCSFSGPFASRGYLNALNQIGADGTTIYISFMQQCAGPDAPISYFEFEFKRDLNGSQTDSARMGDSGRIGGIGGLTGAYVQLRAPNGIQTIIGEGDTAVNLYVVRIDYLEGNDTITVYRNPTGAGESANTPALVAPYQADMSFNGISIGAFNNGTIALHDEIRIGTTWEDVIGGPPGWISNPISQSVLVGDSIILSASAVSDQPLTYQWYHGNDPVPGATGTDLPLSDLQTAAAGGYYIVAESGGASITSTVAQITFRPTDIRYLLAYEGFNYTAGSNNLVGLNGGAGWSNAWQTISGAAGSIITQDGAGSLVADTNAPIGYDARSLGNFEYQQNGSRAGRWLDCSTNGTFGLQGYLDARNHIGADGKTLYISFMQQCSAGNAPRYFYEFEIKRDNLGDAGRIAGIGNGQGGFLDSTNFTFRAPGLFMDQSLGEGDTNVNFYVIRIDYQPGADNVFVYRNPTGNTEMDSVPTISSLALADMSFNGISFGVFNNSVVLSHDEIRIGASWEDVVGTAVGFVSHPQDQETFPQGAATFSALAVSDEPVSYQWYHWSDPVPGGTNSNLPLTNVQLSDAGDYFVVASTTSGSVASTVATLDLYLLRIDEQPKNTAAPLGGSFTLSLEASGTPPISYQWVKDGLPVSGATDASFSLNSVDILDAGDYWCVVTNPLSAVTSSVVLVSVYAGQNALLTYEGFDYDVGDNNLAGMAGGMGWGAPWQTIQGAGGSIISASASGSMLAFANAPSNYDAHSMGNAAYQPNATRNGRWLDCSPSGPFALRGYVNDNINPTTGFGNIGANGKRLYISFLQQSGEPEPLTSYWEFELHRNNLGDSGRIGGIGNGVAGTNLNLRAPNTVANRSLGAADTNVNFIVVRIDYKAGNDDIRVYRNPTSDKEPPDPTLTVSDVADMSFDGISLGAFTGSRTVSHDEIRLGGTWEDVLGLVTSNLLPPERVINGWRIRFAGSPDYLYRLQRATGVNGPWTDITSITVAANGLGEFTDTDAPPGQAYYRAVQP